MEQLQHTQEDVWVPSVCGMCYGACAIRVHRVNGKAIKIEGFPESSQGYGRLCGKGVAGLQNLYDPNRVNYPLKRTNPEKGIGVDPKWERISWEEALNIITEKLKEIRQRDPRELFLQGTTIHAVHLAWGLFPFLISFGSNSFWVSGGGVHCGQGAHMLAGINHASWDMVPDWDYCNYAILFGGSHGHAAGHSAVLSAQLGAEARSRGLKLVVFDPMCNYAGGKATEWVPIIPGTDTIVALAMINVILNELDIYDAEHLKLKTNGPYLVGPDGYFVRDKATGKPLVWDQKGGLARVFDDPQIKDFALEGSYPVNGIKCRPAFQIFREHVKKFTCEEASRVSTVPAQTVRRIAREFAEAARVGSTITIQGKELPYRPAAAVIFRGAQGHTNTVHACAAVGLLNQIVGAADVPGGAIGWPAVCHGFPGTGKYKFMPYPDENGMLVPGRWFFPGLHAPSCKEEEIKIPAADMGLKGTFPYVGMPATPGWTDQEEMWQKLGLPFRPQMLINYGCNSVMSNAAPEIVLNNFKKIPLIVSFDLFITEFSESLADLVLPDTSYLEQLTLEGVVPIFNMAYGLHPWSYHIRQPVVEPLFERRQCVEVLIEITKRIGIYENFINVANWFFGIEEPYKLDPKRDYRWADICDAHLKSNFGPEHGLKWFKKHGGMIWPKKVEEAYWRPFINARVPVYFDFLKKFGEKARKLLEPRGINIEWEQYTALIDWFSCPPHKVGDSTCDLYAFSYRDVVHTGTWTMQLPWIDEVSVRNPYTYTIALSEDTGKKKGIKDGDIVYLESASGRKVKGVAKLMQGIHPSTVALAACSGHWSKGLPIAKGKGTHYNTLMDSNITTHDPIAHGMETCVKVKIYKA